MQSTLALTALFMGLAGGPHCIAMCGAACVGIREAAPDRKATALSLFQLGRLIGYSALGALAAASLQGLGWLTVHSAALRPVWSLFHVAAMVLGLVLVWQARQPVWLEGAARGLWLKVRAVVQRGGQGTPLAVGLAWALLPCGLLYSALMVAALAGSVPAGAGVMALFALGSGISLAVGPWLWQRLRSAGPRAGSGAWGVRLAGAALVASSAWALWMALAHNAAPWCVTPSA